MLGYEAFICVSYVGYRWLGVFNSRNSLLFFEVLLVLDWPNLLIGTFPAFINSVIKRSPCLTNVTDVAFTPYGVRGIEENTNVKAL